MSPPVVGADGYADHAHGRKIKMVPSYDDKAAAGDGEVDAGMDDKAKESTQMRLNRPGVALLMGARTVLAER